eukprot:1390458-Pyramimonas_sp.AAC.1
MAIARTFAFKLLLAQRSPNQTLHFCATTLRKSTRQRQCAIISKMPCVVACFMILRRLHLLAN